MAPHCSVERHSTRTDPFASSRYANCSSLTQKHTTRAGGGGASEASHWSPLATTAGKAAEVDSGRRRTLWAGTPSARDACLDSSRCMKVAMASSGIPLVSTRSGICTS